MRLHGIRPVRCSGVVRPGLSRLSGACVPRPMDGHEGQEKTRGNTRQEKRDKFLLMVLVLAISWENGLSDRLDQGRSGRRKPVLPMDRHTSRVSPGVSVAYCTCSGARSWRARMDIPGPAAFPYRWSVRL